MEQLHAYLRVSTRVQEEEGTSLASQESEALKKAKQLGLTPVIHNEQGKSASDETLDERVVLFNLLEKMKLGEVKNLFVYNNDRLSRNTTTFTIIRKHLRENGVTLYTPTGKVNLEDDRDDLMFGILGEFAQYENRIRRARLIQGKRARVLQGGWQGGAEPFGYRNDNGTLVVDEKESKWLRKIFKWWGEGKTTMWIKLQLDGNVLTRRKKDTWSLGSIEAIIRNTHYIGYYYYKGERVSTERILTDEEYEPVAQRLSDLQKKLSKRGNNRTSKNSYMLKPLLTCGHCGGKMGGTHQHGRFSYICISKRNQYKEKSPTGDERYNRKRGCYMNYGVELETLENHVFEVVYEVVKYSNLTKDRFKKQIMDKDTKAKVNYDSDVKRLNKKINDNKTLIKSIDKRLGEVEVELLNKKINKSTYSSITNALNNQSSKLNKEINNLNKDVDRMMLLTHSNKPNDWYDMYKSDVEDMYKVEGEDRFEKISQYVDSIQVYLDENKIHHIIKINFKYPIVNDKIIWNNRDDIEKGYTIKEGRRVKLLYLKKKQRVRATRWFTPAKLGDGVII